MKNEPELTQLRIAGEGPEFGLRVDRLPDGDLRIELWRHGKLLGGTILPWYDHVWEGEIDWFELLAENDYGPGLLTNEAAWRRFANNLFEFGEP
jgi:hypothetical protein